MGLCFLPTRDSTPICYKYLVEKQRQPCRTVMTPFCGFQISSVLHQINASTTGVQQKFSYIKVIVAFIQCQKDVGCIIISNQWHLSLKAFQLWYAVSIYVLSFPELYSIKTDYITTTLLALLSLSVSNYDLCKQTWPRHLS
ncbi:Hypothetical_protein [Hexamita inflata]|uniref:Hypothetical_protein n=1 Tax=Hexamita inflata TaxID=28002 RepID=A0AA86UXM2_9EUKA|nr:Hypothetical protein HINF_LOCUS63630 [Hexamita inflata]